MSNLIKITEFNIEINKENVLKLISCFPESSVYEHISHEYDRILPAAKCLIKPCAFAKTSGNAVYCLLTLGGEISDYSKRLFDSGEAMDGLIVNAIADEFIFFMDEVLGEHIKTECAKAKKGILRRLEFPDIAPERQQEILDATGCDKITLTDGFMFSPVKTCGYILELTDDSGIFNAQHDCSKCKSVNCPRRSAPLAAEMEVLSDYGYTPLCSGETVICIDIGTTTLAFELIRDGKIQASHTELNAQRRFGADVLSRIEASNRGRGAELRQIIQYQLLEGIRTLTKNQYKADKIVIAANTAMVYLLMGFSCGELGAYPFAASHTGTIEMNFKELIPNDFIDAKTVILGGLSAFVGGDITSGLYMCDFDLYEKINLFIDMGTNGEMAIGGREQITVTSTAAGPAFEGGRIGLGLSGSEVISAVSDLLSNKIIDKTGLLIPKYFEKGYPVTDKIRFTQSDIREVQTAKSAIRSGIEALMHHLDIKAADIDTFYLAGGFGHGLDIKKACNIGLIPSELAGKVKILGNSALGGAVRYALEGGRDRIENMKKISREIQLGNDAVFNEIYIKNMNF